MERIDIISNAILSTVAFLENEIQCVENEYLAEEYQEIIDELKKASQIAQEMANS